MKFNTLPKELLRFIFSFLDTQSLARTCSALNEFNKIIKSDNELMKLITNAAFNVEKSNEYYKKACSSTTDSLDTKLNLLEAAYTAAFTHSQKLPAATLLKQMYKATLLQQITTESLSGATVLSKEGMGLHKKYQFWKAQEAEHKKSISKPQKRDCIKCVIS